MAAAAGDAATATAAPAPAPATPAPGILSEAFGRRLFLYQHEGIAFAVAAGGRCLIADEMGLGKTAQAIGVLGAFAAELPALIVVPASVKFSWASELEKWTTIPAAHIKLIRSRNDCDALRGADVVILTYGMLSDKAAVVEAIQRTQFRIVVLDESHAIKNSKSQRFQLLAPILRNAQRLIMLSGTPALARPVELYTQVSAIAPAAFGSFPAYTKRFCNAHQGRFGWDVSGASNVQELHEKLKTVMIRRLKKAVLTQLPDKIRQRVTVEVPPDKLKAMKATIAELDELKKKAFGGDDGGLGDPDDSGRFEHGRVLNEAYRMTGEAKIQGAIAYLQDALEGSSEQILLFAHHKAVLDAMEQALNRGKTTYIRIDGSTPTAERHRLVTTFQKDAKYRVALLSLTAAGQGITLTAATRVIFAELHWTPGVLLQAEDRAHRIGQKSHVSVVYLVAEGYTIDSIVWGILAKKTHLLSKTLDGKADKLEADVVKKGQAGGGKGKVVTGEEELTMFFAAEQDQCGAGGGSGGRSGGRSGGAGKSAGGGSFPKGDVRGFFARPSSTTPCTSSKKPPPPPKQKGEPVVLLVDDDDDDENTESEGEVELILPPPSSSASASKPAAATASSTSRRRASPAAAPPPPLGPRQQPPSISNNDNSMLIWSCGICTYNNRRPRPAPSSKAPVTCEMCHLPAPPALQPPPRGVGSKSKAPSTPASASSSSSSLSSSSSSTAAAGAPPKKLAKLADQAAFSSAAAPAPAAKESEGLLRDRLTFSVSENTGRITLEESSGGPPRATSAPFSPPPAARCNFSIDEYNDVVAAKGANPSSSLLNTPFEALAAALPPRLAADGGGGNHAADDAAVGQALLAEVGRFVDQWTALRGWERKALIGRALRLPLAAQLQAAEEERRKQQGPCFDRYLPPASGASSASGGDQSRATGGAAAAPAPAYVPGKPKAPSSMAAAPRPSKSPGSQASQQSSSTSSSSQPLPECAWCHVQITDAQTLRNLALQQGVGGARRGHVYCSFSCGEELLLRAGSSSLIRRQLFAMEAGVCQLCGRDAQALFHKVKSLTPPERVQELMQLGVLKHFPEAAIQRPQEHHFWQADHELPVVEGGGQCGLENLRTLCVPCHKVETAALRQRMKRAKDLRAATGTKDLRACFAGGQGADAGGGGGGETAH